MEGTANHFSAHPECTIYDSKSYQDSTALGMSVSRLQHLSTPLIEFSEGLFHNYTQTLSIRLGLLATEK